MRKPRAWARCSCTAKPKPNSMENRVHDFDSKKTRMIANASWSVGEFQATESAPKPYMFTKSTPNRAKPRTISTSTMREAGATGPVVTRLKAQPYARGGHEWHFDPVQGLSIPL